MLGALAVDFHRSIHIDCLHQFSQGIGVKLLNAHIGNIGGQRNTPFALRFVDSPDFTAGVTGIEFTDGQIYDIKTWSEGMVCKTVSADQVCKDSRIAAQGVQSLVRNIVTQNSPDIPVSGLFGLPERTYGEYPYRSAPLVS